MTVYSFLNLPNPEALLIGGVSPSGINSSNIPLTPQLSSSSSEKKYLNKDTLGHIYVSDSLLNMPSISKEEIRGLMKTFVLYARLPRSYWKEIKIAEMETKEGINKYHELMNLYKNNYSKAGVAPN